jgi:hypothetical protein
VLHIRPPIVCCGMGMGGLNQKCLAGASVAQTSSPKVTKSSLSGDVIRHSPAPTGRVISAMARSGLLPSPLARLWGSQRVPLVALLLSSVVCLMVCALCYENPGLIEAGHSLIVLCSCLTYISQCVSFLLVRMS